MMRPTRTKKEIVHTINKSRIVLTILLLSIALTANAACESVVRDLPDMPVGPGEEITVGLTQNGFLANVVKVADILPAGFEYVSGSYTGSREEFYYPSNNTLVMMLAGNVSHPEITVTYNVTTGSVAQINDGWFFGTYSGFAIEPVPGAVEGLVSGDATLTPDTTAPAIDSVELNETTVTAGDPILVTVDATDDVRIVSVTADDVELTESGDDIWIGVIIADEGTHFVNVSATDTSGNVGWNNSTSYTTDVDDQTGDIDSDGDVDLFDAIHLAKYYTGAGSEKFRTIHADGDIDSDGDVDLFDAIHLAKYYTGAGSDKFRTIYP